MRAPSMVTGSGGRGSRKGPSGRHGKPKKAAKKHLLQQPGCVEYASRSQGLAPD